MNIVEREAINFANHFYDGVEINSLENLKSELTSALYNFNRDRDKLDFLKIVRQETNNQTEKHKEGCKKTDCDFVKDRAVGIFVIDQEVDQINKYYTYEPKAEDSFTPEEESNLHQKLNDIIDKLNSQGLGQQVIFEEIESLKDHFNLGKKTWFQLVKGKVVDLTLEKALEKTVIAEIFAMLSEGYKDIGRFLE